MTDSKPVQSELFELKSNIYRNKTTKCTRINGDRRSERSHQYRKNHCRLVDQKHSRGRRKNDHTKSD